MNDKLDNDTGLSLEDCVTLLENATTDADVLDAWGRASKLSIANVTTLFKRFEKTILSAIMRQTIAGRFDTDDETKAGAARWLKENEGSSTMEPWTSSLRTYGR